MSFDNQFGSSGFKAYAPFDADNRVAYVGIAANGVRGTNFFNLLDCLDFIVKLFAINSNNLAFLKLDFQ